MSEYSSQKYIVPYADTDQMGVVYYANYLVYFERSRNALLKDIGFPYSTFEKQGVMLPVIESGAKYYKPALFEDELTLIGGIEWVKRVKVKFNNSVYRNNELIAEGFTVHGVISSRERRPQAMPEDFLKRIYANKN